MNRILSFFAVLLLYQSLYAAPDFFIRGLEGNWSDTPEEWKFTQTGDIYRLHIDRLTSSSSWKIATVDWTLQFGTHEAFSFEKAMKCVAGDGNNFRVPQQGGEECVVNGATLIFDYSNASVPTLTVVPDLYLTGEFNNWNNTQENYRFRYDNGIFTLSVGRLSGEFKIAAGITPQWTIEYGCSSEIELKQPTLCQLNGPNMRLAEPADYRLDISFDSDTHIITIEGMPTLYLIGEFNGWGISPLYAFTYDDGVYTLTTHDFTGPFRISTYDYSQQFGSTCDSPFALGVNYPLCETSAQNASFGGVSAGGDSRVKLTFVADGTPDAIDATLSDSAAPDGPTEYYNLQGIRVMRPSRGIFIRRQGNLVDKIEIK